MFRIPDQQKNSKPRLVDPPNVIVCSFVFRDFSFKVAVSLHVEGGRLLRLLFRLECKCFLGIQIKKCRLASYLMEHIYFEAQLCSEIATLKEKSGKAKDQTFTFGGGSNELLMVHTDRPAKGDRSEGIICFCVFSRFILLDVWKL